MTHVASSKNVLAHLLARRKSYVLCWVLLNVNMTVTSKWKGQNTSAHASNFKLPSLNEWLLMATNHNQDDCLGVRSHLTTMMCFCCHHVRTASLVTMQTISDNMLTTSKICVTVAKWDRTLKIHLKWQTRLKHYLPAISLAQGNKEKLLSNWCRCEQQRLLTKFGKRG